MSPSRKALVRCLAAVALAGATAIAAAPPSSGAHPGRPPGPPGHSGHHGGHGHSHGYWGWGLGLALTAPYWGGWYGPGWRYPAFGPYPYYAYGPSDGFPAYACEYPADCWRERPVTVAPTPPTTQVAPSPGAGGGGPSERPLHLNYCDAARAWFPAVRTCPGGWRLVLPEYR